jgi:hypothetical protein
MLTNISVGLPVFNSKKIAWLAMEGLCNQTTKYSWELIVCEEQHPEMLGVEFYKSYTERLTQAGCLEIIYICPKEWVNLIKKWQLIGERARGQTFIMQAADCYSPKHRLSLSHEEILKGADWVDFTKGYFYDFPTKRMILYNSHNRTNLNMGFKTEYMKKLPHSPQRSAVDGYLHINFNKMKPNFKTVNLNFLYDDSLDTNGCNNISKRATYFDSPKAPFESTEMTIDRLALPENVKQRISEM